MAVILGATQWGGVSAQVGQKREKELRELCRLLIDGGAQMIRFENTSDSAWEAVNLIAHPKIGDQSFQISKDLRDRLLLQSQKELEKAIPNTEGGGALRRLLQGFASKKDSADLDERTQFIESLANQIAQLRAPIWHFLMRLFS